LKKDKRFEEERFMGYTLKQELHDKMSFIEIIQKLENYQEFSKSNLENLNYDSIKKEYTED
jgi:hypothetical protein